MANRASRLVAVIVVPLALAACDVNARGDINGLSAPSALADEKPFGDPAPFAGVSIVPATIALVPLGGPGCPFASPFTSSFVLLVDGGRGRGLFLSQVGFDFIDTTGLAFRALYSQTDVSEMFGTTLVPPGTSRRFRFAERFGCGLVSRPRWLRARAWLRDHHGAMHDRTATAGLQ